MDDPTLAFKLFERAQEAGIKTIAIHKAAPLGPVPMDPYRIDDVDGAAFAFPDLTFEIIHAGIAFTRETALAVMRFPNVYANLEMTASLLVKAPRQFEHVLAEFLLFAGPEKIIYSDGNMVLHSQPILERFRDLQFSQETVDTWGVQLDDDAKRLILGENYARIAGIDIEAAKAQIADDQFARERANAGIQKPFSNWYKDFEAGVRADEFQPDGWLVGAA
jgi:hypothetical protein